MKKRIFRYFNFVLLFLSAFVLSCVNSEEYKKIKKEFRDVEYNEDFETFDSIYASIPDYSDVSSTINSMHTVFNGEILLSYESAGLYTSSKNTAVAIGMYIADLGYVRHFERVQFCKDYLEALKVLVQKMAVGARDFNKMIPEFEKNLNNSDRLFELTDSLMNSGNVLLSNSEMYGISALVLGGLWLETTYIGLMHSEELSKNEFIEKLSGHFKILGQINLLFDCLSDESVISELKDDLRNIQEKGPENQSLLADIVEVRNKFLL